MKKIINNKVYNTDTAKKVGMIWIGPELDRTGWEELYRKKTGEFFTLYHRYNDHFEKITPLTYDEAQEWAEKHLDGDDYINIFGEPEESDETANLHIQISKSAYTKIKQAAAKQGVSLAKYIESIV